MSRKDIESRLEFITMLERSFAEPSGTQKGPERLEDFASHMTIIDKGVGESVAVYFGNGYALATNHGVTDNGHPILNSDVWVEYERSFAAPDLSSGLSAAVSDIITTNQQDLVLLYITHLCNLSRGYRDYPLSRGQTIEAGRLMPVSTNIRFRSPKTLKIGESVFMVAFDPELYSRPYAGPESYRPSVVKGTVTSFSGPANYSNQFQTSVPVKYGHSGSPLFDQCGNLLGTASSHAFGGGNKSSFAGIDGLQQLFQSEKERLVACLKC